MRRIVEQRVLHQGDVIARNPFRHDIGPVADIMFGLGPAVAEFQISVARNGPGDLMVHQFGQIGGRMFEGDHQRLVVRRRNAKGRGRQFAGTDRLGVLHHPKIIGVRRGGFRIDETPPSENEIARRHRHAVGPQMIAQMERPAQPVGGNLPMRGGSGDGLGARAFRRQAHDHIADHKGLPGSLHEGRIEALDIRTVAAIEDGAGRIVCPASSAAKASTARRSAQARARLNDRDAAIEREVTGAVDVDVIVHPALDLTRNQIARHAEIYRRDRHIVEHQLFGLLQDGGAGGGIADAIGSLDQRIIGRVAVVAVIEIARRALQQEQKILRVAVIGHPSRPARRQNRACAWCRTEPGFPKE